MTTTDNSPDATVAHNTGAPNSAAPILDAFDAIAAKGGDPKEIAGAQFQFIMEQIRGNALPFFKELRDNRPILQSPMATLVARFRDVEEILYREKVFSVSPYLPRMMGVIGPFVLSQDITPRYDHDISVMRLVVRREDLPRVKDIVSRHAGAVVSELFQGSGPVDIVQTLTRKVPVRLADEYFGFFGLGPVLLPRVLHQPPGRPRGPGPCRRGGRRDARASRRASGGAPRLGR